MESPFYEMTHDIQYENEISENAFRKGYSEGTRNERDRFEDLLIKMSDEQVIEYVHNLREREKELCALKEMILKLAGAK